MESGSFAVDHLLECCGEADTRRRSDGFRITFRKVCDQRKPGGGGSDQKALAVITDDVKRLPRSERLDIDDGEPRAGNTVDLEPLPAAESPGARQEEADYKKEGAGQADDGGSDIGKGRKGRGLSTLDGQWNTANQCDQPEG